MTNHIQYYYPITFVSSYDGTKYDVFYDNNKCGNIKYGIITSEEDEDGILWIWEYGDNTICNYSLDYIQAKIIEWIYKQQLLQITTASSTNNFPISYGILIKDLLND